MSSLNNWNGTGSLGRDPESREVGDRTVCNFSIAVNGFKKDDAPLWIDVAVWGAQATHCMTYLTKGSQVAVSGRIGLRTYSKNNGEAGASITLDARDVVFIGGKSDDAKSDRRPVQQRQADAEMPW